MSGSPKGDSSQKSLFCLKKLEDPGLLGVLVLVGVLVGVLVESCGGGGDVVFLEFWSQISVESCSKRLVIQEAGRG